MTEYVMASDNINGKERQYLEAMRKILNSNGNSCEVLGVGPGVLQRNGKKQSATGKTGVFLVGGSDLGTYYDFYMGIGKYYNYKRVIFAFASWTAKTWITCKELKTRKLVRAHDDNFSSSAINKWIGKTAAEVFEEWKSKIGYVCGDTPEALAQKIVGGSNNNTNNGNGVGGDSSTIKDVLKKLLSYYDGYIECRVLGDEVHINKITLPPAEELPVIKEGLNIVDDSVSIKDHTPNSPNVVIVHSDGRNIKIYDDGRINRFGEHTLDIDIPGIPKSELPERGQYEYKKANRDNNFSIELKVIGDRLYNVGEWVYVVIPSYNIEARLYITKVSNSLSPDSDGTIGLTLAIYPPSLGKYEEENNEEEEEEDGEVEE